MSTKIDVPAAPASKDHPNVAARGSQRVTLNAIRPALTVGRVNHPYQGITSPDWASIRMSSVQKMTPAKNPNRT